ncbi:hypothetical protein ABT160_28395 [Streptomyces sp. NPDC001941]|uniref:DUF7878 domain-containing protein n=1 Tax=Streptomyces sp. NPDC001941 TaxID=3154659 RepID=UPI003327DCFE
MLLLDIEAELSIWEQGRVVWSQEAFPVAELAYHVALWFQNPASAREGFALDSMQAGTGLIRITGSGQGWRVGSRLTPAFWTSPVTWDVLAAAIKGFDQSVREGVTTLGIDPAFLPCT